MTATKPDKPAPLFGVAEPWKPAIAKCSSCGAEIVWATTEAGKPCPFDAKMRTAYSINPAGIAAPIRGYVSHFTTCPNATQHSRGS